MSRYQLGEIEDRFPMDVLVGVDEVGVGALAGPVVAAAVILDLLLPTDGIQDSKKLTEIRRTIMAKKIREEALLVRTHMISAARVDDLGIFRASNLARRNAVLDLLLDYDLEGHGAAIRIVVDGDTPLPTHTNLRRIPQSLIVKGDQRSWSVAAASIVAKDLRDEWMRNVAETWGDYGFKRHKGYGTPEHLQKLKILGPCRIHRMSMEPVKRALLERGIRTQ